MVNYSHLWAIWQVTNAPVNIKKYKIKPLKNSNNNNIYKTIRCHNKMPLQKQFLSTTRQRGTSQSWYFRGVSLLLLSTSRRCINKRLPLVPFWTASLSVTMGTQSSQLFCCEECLSPCWHTSSATNSLCAMGSTCMALIASRCKMNAFLVSISRKCKSTVPYQQQSCCGWTNTEWTGLVCQPLSQPSVYLHPPPFSSPSPLDIQVDGGAHRHLPRAHPLHNIKWVISDPSHRS